MNSGDFSKKLSNWLTYPFRRDILFYILIWLMLAAPECMIQLAKGNFLYSFLFLLLYLGVAYIILLPLDICRWTRRVLKPLFYFALTLLTALNLYCIYRYHTRITYDIVEIIGATNPSEAKEYLSMYIGWKEYLLLACYIIACVFLYWASNKFRVPKLEIPWTLMALLLIISAISAFFNPALEQSFETWKFNFDDIADLSKYPTHPKIEESDSIHPEEIVIIIGESFAPSHSSLYGYDKTTNPRLEALRDSGLVFVFQDVKSPATHTANAFKLILNTLKSGEEKHQKWYKDTNLIEVLKTAGYHTSWISNQAKTGLYNNICSSFSALTDEAIFPREFYDEKIYDGELLDLTPARTNVKNATFYHLMGQHVNFADRYPDEFNKFSAKDYPQFSGNIEKQTNVASYDNATLYNDFVVADIMDHYADKDAIVFYFSDHGLDVYQSSEDYCGHAVNTPASIEAGYAIPFMVYISPLFKKRHPQTVEKIENALSKEYSTDLLIYTVMDAAGYKFKDNDDVNRYSLF